MNFSIKKINFSIFLILVLALFLRFYQLAADPPSPYWEEAALGYDAYSLLKTGMDHRGNSWPLVYIASYMDFKPPLFVYTAIPSVAVFGLDVFAVRFPSAFFGSLTVLVVYVLAKELFKEKPILSIASAFLLAISPWHIQFSRAAFEANVALFLVTTGVYLFLISLRKKLFLLGSVLCFALSMYAYHASRIFVPLIVVFLVIIFFKKLWQMGWLILFGGLIGLLLTLPLLKTLTTTEVTQRFQETSAFTDLQPILESNKEIAEDGGGRIAKIIHHRFWEYGRIFLNNYFNHFTGSYLFLRGDGNPRHSTQEFGVVYHWEIVTLILGIVLVVKRHSRKDILLVGWLCFSIVPGAITQASPHSLRTIFGLPPFILISGLGLTELLTVFKKQKIIVCSLASIIIIELILYLHFYYQHYPKLYSSHWQYGYKEAVNYIMANQSKYDSIYLTNYYGRAYMYYLFFSKLEPIQAQNFIQPYRKIPDIPQIGKVSFIKPAINGSALWILAPGEQGSVNKTSSVKLESINDLNNQTVFEIWQIKE
jgi:4-amino-4-deoxy-L-arabinose transferase-like glycosyltransferase